MMSLPRLSKLSRSWPSKRGFTLVELLVAISIIGVLASMILVMARGVQVDAQVSKTRGTVSKISEVLTAKYEQLLTAPMSLTIPERALAPRTVIVNGTSQSMPGVTTREAALVRLIAMRDLMRMMLPERHEDLPVLTDTTGGSPSSTYFPPSPILLRTLVDGSTYGTLQIFPGNAVEAAQLTNAIPGDAYAVAQAMISRFVTALPNRGVSPANVRWWTNNENAELLYAIVESTVINGSSAIEMFKSSEIGDTDADNCPEFIDAWGTPIGFIRWPSGSPMSGMSLMEDPFGSGDPFDPMKADVGYELTNVAYHPGKGLFPMVVSAGPNGLFGVNFIEARKPEFGGGAGAAWSGKVLLAVSEALPANYNLPGGSVPPAFPPKPPAAGGRYDLSASIPSPYVPSASYLYPDPYYPRGGVSNYLLLRSGFPWYADAAADNITNLDPSGESL